MLSEMPAFQKQAGESEKAAFKGEARTASPEETG